MSQPRSRGRRLRHLAAPALALALIAGLPFATATEQAAPTTDEWNTVSAISVTHKGKGKENGKTVKANFLSYNDFHGAIDPPTGSGAAVDGTPAGGVEYLPPGSRSCAPRRSARVARPSPSVPAT